MRTLTDRIVAEEERFFNEHLIRPNVIIVRPEIKSDLMERVGLDPMEEEMDTYEGMVLTVTFSDRFPDFKLGFVNETIY
jgi:hypothetical protein